jgi:hypothetical protein
MDDDPTAPHTSHLADPPLITNTEIPRSENWKLRAQEPEIVEDISSRRSDVLLFCHGAFPGPGNRDGTLISKAACAASYKGKTTEVLTRILGPKSSAWDTAFRPLS